MGEENWRVFKVLDRPWTKRGGLDSREWGWRRKIKDQRRMRFPRGLHGCNTKISYSLYLFTDG